MRLTRAINFAFGTNIVNGAQGLSNQSFVGSAVVNIPFKVKEVVVKEMFSAPLNQVPIVEMGFIGGDTVTLGTTSSLISAGMKISGTNVDPISTVVYVNSGTVLTCNIIQAVPSTTLSFYTDIPYSSSIGTTLTLLNPNPLLITGQTLSGTGFTTCTLGVQLSPLTWTISTSQTGNYILLYSSVAIATSTIGGNVLVLNNYTDVAVGTSVTGTGVTISTTITGGFGGEFLVNNVQVVPSTSLTLTNPNNNYTLSELVQVVGIDGLFPPQSCLGCLTMGTDLIASTNFIHDTHHYHDPPRWLRGQYDIQLLKADGVLQPTDAFVGHVCVICEFIGE